MSDIVSIPFVPGTGLNYDDDPRFMQPGDGYRKNVMPVSDGADGLLKSIKGNILETLSPAITGTTQSVVGATYDVKTRSIIFFVKSRTGATIYDTIIRYNISTETFTRIISENALLDFDDRVEARVLDDYLIWTSPDVHAISISEAIAFTAGSSSEYTGDGGTPANLTAEEMSFIRYAPVSAPTVTYKSDATYAYNHLRGRQFQFCYKYEYYDHSHSVWSPISKVPLGEADEDIYGNFVEDEQINNVIEVDIPEGSDIIKKIYVAAREGNTALFRLVTVIDKDEYDNYEYGEYTYEFKNDTRGNIVPDEEVFRLYDDIPREADFVEVIDKNIVCLGQRKTGYDPPVPNVSLSYDIKNVTLASFSSPGTATEEYDSENEWITWLLPDIDYEDVEVEVGYAAYLDQENEVQYEVYKKTFGALETRTDVLTYFTSTLTIPFDSYVDGGNTYLRCPSQDAMGALVISTDDDAGYVTISDASITEDTEKFFSFKFGEQHSFALGYKDEQGRLMYLLRSDDMDIDIPFLRGTVDLGARVEIDWTISHAAPTGAKYYQWFYAKNTPTFYQIALSSDEISLRTGGYYLNINGAADRYKDAGIQVPYYTFTEGDRLRIIGHGDLDNLTPLTTLYDTEIKGEKVDGDDTYIIMAEGAYDYREETWVFIEIYTPRQATSGIYQEFSDTFEISGGTHDDLEGTFDNGDVYARLVVPWFWGEAQSYSYYYDSDSVSIGRPAFYDPNQREVELTDIIHGGRYFEDTQINELFTFRSNPPAVFSKRYGDINGMILRGDTLKVYQEKKTHSVYIGAAIIRRPTGTEELVASDRILGTVVTSREDWGCQHPDSIIKVDNNIYFYDGYGHAFLRDSVNGIFPISGKVQTRDYAFDYKMRTYFKNDFTDVRCGYDPLTELLFVKTDSDTLSFHENSNRWVSFYDFTPDHMFGAEKTFLSWEDGLTYRHNPSEATEADNYKYYGVAYDSTVTFYPSFPVKRIFKSIALHSNKAMDVDIEIPLDESYIRGMESWIDADWFILKRGVYYHAFLRNALTSSAGTSFADLHNGEKLRGYFAEIKLEESIIELFKVDILVE